MIQTKKDPRLDRRTICLVEVGVKGSVDKEPLEFIRSRNGEFILLGFDLDRRLGFELVLWELDGGRLALKRPRVPIGRRLPACMGGRKQRALCIVGSPLAGDTGHGAHPIDACGRFTGGIGASAEGVLASVQVQMQTRSAGAGRALGCHPARLGRGWRWTFGTTGTPENVDIVGRNAFGTADGAVLPVWVRLDDGELVESSGSGSRCLDGVAYFDGKDLVLDGELVRGAVVFRLDGGGVASTL